jgi:hypothetical protein
VAVDPALAEEYANIYFSTCDVTVVASSEDAGAPHCQLQTCASVAFARASKLASAVVTLAGPSDDHRKYATDSIPNYRSAAELASLAGGIAAATPPAH